MRAIAIHLFKKWKTTSADDFEVFKSQLLSALSKQESAKESTINVSNAQMAPTAPQNYELDFKTSLDDVLNKVVTSFKNDNN